MGLLRSSRRRSFRTGLRPVVEALEGRLCLSTVDGALSWSRWASAYLDLATASTFHADARGLSASRQGTGAPAPAAAHRAAELDSGSPPGTPDGGNSTHPQTPDTITIYGPNGFKYTRLGNPQDAGLLRGSGGLALEGGGTDIDQVFMWMEGQMGGKGDFLVLRSTDDTLYNTYVDGLDPSGFNSVATLDIPNRNAAFEPAVQQIIEKASAVFIGGGDQGDYINFWQGTPVQQAIDDDLARGVPIGGTSAGTDVIGQFINSAEQSSLISDKALKNPFDPNLTLAENFIAPNRVPFLNNTIIDTHFVARDRMGRMLAFLARIEGNGWSPNNQPMGIGINEQTALLITPDGHAQVIDNPGAPDPNVYFLQTPDLRAPGSSLVLAKSTPLTYKPITVTRVTAGGSFDLSDWPGSAATSDPFTLTYTIAANQGVLSSSNGSSVY
jgi:cyanophycinase